MENTFSLIRKYPKYEVSKEGVVRNTATQKQLPQINTAEGAMVILRQDGRLRFVSIIQLVVETYLDMWYQMSKGGWGVTPNDGNYYNSNVNNLDCYRLEIEDVDDNQYHELLDFIMSTD
jgi:hypothetical protein